MVLTINVACGIQLFASASARDGSKILYGILPDSAFPVIEFLESTRLSFS